MQTLEMISIYLDHKNTRKEDLEYYNRFFEPMDPSCLGCVIIPAHNEEDNIIDLIKLLNNQSFSENIELSHDKFEIIIVNNNSTDNTQKVIEDYLKKINLLIKIRLINVAFSEEERGVGSARKLGADFALYRAYLSDNKRDFNNFYIIGIDAENYIPKNHIEEIITNFRNSKADVLVGIFEYDASIYDKGSDIYRITESVNHYNNSLIDYIVPPGLKLCGGNHAITAKMYAQIGGYERIRIFEDINLGLASEKQKANIAWLRSCIKDNPRRMRLDPLGYITGEAWSINDFLDTTETVRNNNIIDTDYSDEEIKKTLTVFIGRQSKIISESQNALISEIYANELKRFINILNLNGVRKELHPDNDLVWFDRINARSIRIVMDNKNKLFLLNEDIRELVNIIENDNVLLYGGLALWLLMKESYKVEVPYMASLLTFSDTVQEVNEDFKRLGYELYEIKKEKKIYFYKKIYEVQEGLGNKELFFLKINNDSLPILSDSPAEQINLKVINRDKNYVYLDNNKHLKIERDYLDNNIHYKNKTKICDVRLLVLYFLNNKSHRKYRKNFIDQLDDKNKHEFCSAIEKVINLFRHYIVDILFNKEIIQKDVDNIVNEVITNLFGYLSNKKIIEQASMELKTIYMTESNDLDRDLDNFLLKYI